MIRTGTGEPVVLLHGVTGSENMWRYVVPLLKARYEVIAPTALGHRGGKPGAPGSLVADLVDDMERTLDELGLDRPHLVGNSLGGWMAIELARRGRAASVCALSPAGFWDVSAGEHLLGAAKLRSSAKIATRSRWILPLAGRLRLVRRIALRDVAAHGDRATVDELLELVDDLLGCTLTEELLSTSEEIEALDPIPCPIVLAWSELDRVLPIERSGARARVLLPEATWRVVPGVGHVPMLDDPALVAGVILESLKAAEILSR